MNEIVKTAEEIKVRGHCRICGNFFRVKKHSEFRNVMSTQGFCKVGCLEGSFNLYVSSSQGNNCPAFFVDSYNVETYNKEDELSKLATAFRFNLQDGRSKTTKLLKKRFYSNDEIQKFFNLKGPGHRFVSFALNQDLAENLFSVFREINKEKYDWLWDRKTISETEYWQIIHYLTSQIETGLNGGKVE